MTNRRQFTAEERARYGWPEPPLLAENELRAARHAAARAAAAERDTRAAARRARGVLWIRGWHPGQVAVFCVGATLAWQGARFVFQEMARYSDGFVLQIPALAFIVAIPVVALAVLWIWFGGRPPRGE